MKIDDAFYGYLTPDESERLGRLVDRVLDRLDDPREAIAWRATLQWIVDTVRERGWHET